jgi:hypothetical protein
MCTKRHTAFLTGTNLHVFKFYALSDKVINAVIMLLPGNISAEDIRCSPPEDRIWRHKCNKG